MGLIPSKYGICAVFGETAKLNSKTISENITDYNRLKAMNTFSKSSTAIKIVQKEPTGALCSCRRAAVDLLSKLAQCTIFQIRLAQLSSKHKLFVEDIKTLTRLYRLEEVAVMWQLGS